MKNKQVKLLLLIDAIINLFLGIVLLAYSEPVVKLFGLPSADLSFYPQILGAVLFGIGLALLIEYRGKGTLRGLGLGGAISINLAGGIVLFLWLVSGKLQMPVRGWIILWSLDCILIGISLFELVVYLNARKKKD